MQFSANIIASLLLLVGVLLAMAAISAEAVTPTPHHVQAPVRELPMDCTHTFSTFPNPTYFDLSALATPKGTIVTHQKDQYSINVCNTVNPGPGAEVCPENAATLCFNGANSQGWYPVAMIGDPAQPAWSLLDPENPSAGVQWTYTDSTWQNQTITVQYLLTCNPSVSTPSYSVSNTGNLMTFIATVVSREACPKNSTRAESNSQNEDRSIFQAIQKQ